LAIAPLRKTVIIRAREGEASIPLSLRLDFFVALRTNKPCEPVRGLFLICDARRCGSVTSQSEIDRSPGGRRNA
jgi:hypothetical protein